MVKGLPSCYILFLRCCHQPERDHPICHSGQPPATLHWYPGGPSITHIPLPVPDPERLWGGQTCSSCKGVCAGHYTIKLVDTSDSASLQCLTKPPSNVLKQMFSNLKDGDITDDFISDAAKAVLLSVEDTKIWLNHLLSVLQSRKRGAAKAAASRRMKRQLQEQREQSQHRPEGGGEQSRHRPLREQSQHRPEGGGEQSRHRPLREQSQHRPEGGGEQSQYLLEGGGEQSQHRPEGGGEQSQHLLEGGGEQSQHRPEGGEEQSWHRPQREQSQHRPEGGGEQSRHRPEQAGDQSQHLPQREQSSNGDEESEEVCYCRTCGKEYSLCTEEFWIGCDLYNQWYCCVCEGLISEPISDKYFCRKCSN